MQAESVSHKSLFVSTKAQPSSNRMNLTYFQESLGFWEKSWINDKGPSGEERAYFNLFNKCE